MELYHYGIKGQKWGIRRYQNKDGSYTEAGKKRNFKKIEKMYQKDVKDGYKKRNSGESYRTFARKNPDIATALEPAVKSEQEYYKAVKADGDIYRRIERKMTVDYIKKHGRIPNGEAQEAITRKIQRTVGSPNLDSYYKSNHTAAAKNAIDNVLGDYGDKKLNTFNLNYGRQVLNTYLMKEAYLRNKEGSGV